MAAFKSFKGGGQVTTGGYVVCNKWSDILKLFQDCQRVTAFKGGLNVTIPLPAD